MKKCSRQFLRFTLGLAALMLSLPAIGGGVWTNTGSLNTARYNHTATLLTNGLVLAAGGWNSGYLASAELYYPPTGTWTNTGSLNTARVFHAGTLLTNGLALVAGGQSSSPLTIDSAELYFPAAGTWSNTGSLNAAREDFTLTLLANGLVLASAGEDSGTGTQLSSAELYNPATGTWTNTGSLNTARQTHTATLLPNGLVLVAGGDNNSGTLSSAELYDSATGTWTNTGSLDIARVDHTSTLLPDGLVLVAGGEIFVGTNGSVLASAELYDPATGTWTNTGSLNTARTGHTATLLPNGLVLVAGGTDLPTDGYGSSGDMLTSAELYDPATGTWTNTGSMQTACYDHTATLLADGNVLVAAGRTTNNVPLANVELYEMPQPCIPYPATATATVVDEFVVAATVTDGGCGYTNAPLVFIQGGGGVGAVATAVVSNGVVVSITINNAGSNYTGIPTIVIGGAPSIAAQPQPVTVSVYETASISVTAGGTTQLYYQWLFDGTNISGATSSTLTISNVMQTNLGTYAVVVSNVFGLVTSSNATLSMYPFINTPFTGVVTDWGSNATLSVGAWGTGPLNYQWFDNGVAILNATNQILDLTTIQFTNAGLYSVVVSDPLGSVTNTPEQVVVNVAGVSLGIYPGVTINGAVGYNYIIQSTTNLSNTNSWVNVANVTLTQPVQLWVDTNVNASLPGNPQRYYQVLPGP